MPTSCSALAILHKEIASHGGNAAYSPYNLHSTINMLYFGAAGNCEAVLREKYFGGETPHEAVRQLPLKFDNLADTSSKDVKICLYPANRIYLEQKLEENVFVQKYYDIIRKYSEAGCEYGDFLNDAEAVRGKINQWVNEKTHQKISELIPEGEITNENRLVLVSALYFKGSWDRPFKSASGSWGVDGDKGEFQALLFDGTVEIQKKVRYMESTEFCEEVFCYGYLEGPISNETPIRCTVLEVPYVDQELSMVFFMPHVPSDLPLLEDAWLRKPALLDIFVERVEYNLNKNFGVYMNVRLPYFKIVPEKNKLEMSKALKKMGLGDIFSQATADFSKIDGTKSLFVSDVFHQTALEVNEEGTEAAAATAVVFTFGGLQTKTIEINKPFLFQIRLRKSKRSQYDQADPEKRRDDLVLFMGRVTDILELQIT